MPLKGPTIFQGRAGEGTQKTQKPLGPTPSPNYSTKLWISIELHYLPALALLVLIPIHYLVCPSIDRCHIYYLLCFPLSPRAGRVMTAQIWIWSWMYLSQSHCNVSGSVLHPQVLKSLASRAAAWPMHHRPSCDRLGGGYFVKCGWEQWQRCSDHNHPSPW